MRTRNHPGAHEWTYLVRIRFSRPLLTVQYPLANRTEGQAASWPKVGPTRYQAVALSQRLLLPEHDHAFQGAELTLARHRPFRLVVDSQYLSLDVGKTLSTHLEKNVYQGSFLILVPFAVLRLYAVLGW